MDDKKPESKEVKTRKDFEKIQAGLEEERKRAARKAVVYQWESRKRCPSPLFWQRIREIAACE